ncbi:MAG: threonine ammonia-lyase [Actinomycetota bacterium]
MDLVTLEDISAARETLEGIIQRTPVEQSRALSEMAGGEVLLKCENLQRTGAFKIRGAYNRISKLVPAERRAGVVAASAGNHAQGVALAASLLGVKATVFMPEGASLPKVEATRSYGAEVVLAGTIYDEAFAAAQLLAERTGAVMVHPFDHLDVIAGQGTIAIEILDQIADCASIVVPVGGGGLISGIAAGAKAIRPDIKVIGVEPQGAAEVSASLAAGHLVKLDQLATIADGLAAKQAGELTLAHIQAFVDEVVTVTDDELAEALLLLVERQKLVAEPAGVAGVAAIMKAKTQVPFPCCVLISGGNIDPMLLLRVIRFGMGSSGRYFSFRTRIADRPGELHRLLGVIADAGGNVVGVEHRAQGGSLRHLNEVEVMVQVETRGIDHVEALNQRLKDAGYVVEGI